MNYRCNKAHKECFRNTCPHYEIHPHGIGCDAGDCRYGILKDVCCWEVERKTHSDEQNPWLAYEREKKKLRDTNPTDEEYDIGIADIVERLCI
jgi:hypothetical protein